MFKTYIKVYDQNDLLGKRKNILKRIKFINTYSPNIPSFADTLIYEMDNHFIYEQEWVYKKSIRDYHKNFLIQKLEQLAGDLDRMSALGYVHGDLNRKNILFNGNYFKIIDLEPSLEQIEHNKKKFMFTIPYWSLNDMDRKEITTETDKIGFLAFCNWVINKNFFIKNSLEKFRERFKNRIELFSIDEADLIKMNFNDLIHTRMKNENWNFERRLLDFEVK
jgi:serine/threonine protein kinase